jgi:NTP pyrophosphatase (non-canonical NTP hydrolase)
MTLNEFQELAMTTARKDQEPNDALINAALGLAGEAGEVADNIKKIFWHDHPIDKTKILLELGDCAWYILLAAKALGSSFEEIAQMNIEKLQKRYPNGFNPKDSINRND